MIPLEKFIPFIFEEVHIHLKPKHFFVLDTTLDIPAFIIPLQDEKEVEIVFIGPTEHDDAIEIQVEVYIASSRDASDQIPTRVLFNSRDKNFTIEFLGIDGIFEDKLLLKIFNQLVQIYKNTPKLTEFTIQ